MNTHVMHMQLTVVVGGGRGELDFVYRLAGADRRVLIMTTGTREWTLNPSTINHIMIKLLIFVCNIYFIIRFAIVNIGPNIL